MPAEIAYVYVRAVVSKGRGIGDGIRPGHDLPVDGAVALGIHRKLDGHV